MGNGNYAFLMPGRMSIPYHPTVDFLSTDHSWAKGILCDVRFELLVERCPSLAPVGAHLLFGTDVEVAGRDQRFRSLDFDQDDCFDWILVAFLAVDPLGRLAVNVVTAVQLRPPKEPVSSSRKLLDDVHLDERIALQIRARPRRSDVEKKDVVVVPDADRSFGRQIRPAIGRHSRREAKVRRLDYCAHVGRDYTHWRHSTLSKLQLKTTSWELRAEQLALRAKKLNHLEKPLAAPSRSAQRDVVIEPDEVVRRTDRIAAWPRIDPDSYARGAIAV